MKIGFSVLALVAAAATPAFAGPTAAPPAAAGSHDAPRHVEVDYAAPTSVRDVTYEDAEIEYASYGSATASPAPTDRVVRVVLRDRSGLGVPFLVAQDLNSDGSGDRRLGEFCGSSPPLRIRPAARVMVYLEAGACAGRPATATAGTADFAFSRR